MSIRKWKAAVVQAEPCWFNLEAAVKKTCDLMREAKAGGASLIAFSEVWIPGYPNFLWNGNYRENLSLVQSYIKNSMTATGPEMLEIRKLAAHLGLFVALGFSERDNGSLYLGQVLISSEGNILMHRRKTKPTHVERTIFGDSTGDSLNSVVDTPLGKIGMLNCWEHIQPLLKYYQYAQGEQVHIAAWPFNPPHSGGPEPYNVCSEANEVTASRMYSIEGQVFTLVTNQPLSPAGIKANSSGHNSAAGSFMTSEGWGGASGVFGPDGRKITPDAAPDFDGIIYCDIDLDDIYYAKAIADPVGHYSRPDLLRILVDDRPKNYVVKCGATNGEFEADKPLLAIHKSIDELHSSSSSNSDAPSWDALSS
ncbi:carbon-nitrogen hydrolase [Acaromyces ingoldii]|uniref:Carbon-nitrogen hydrolase n=1 Tax=Acaromyces ingoldii TaxID=215250 RepID=A0A316YUI0_9BASI|nr:carbon-nitrogen hydrolase [Acaromyces ingoldii]PWN92434.1 carbon-nitrogen hydrolase [Acaromyces ingoldii]